MYLAQHYTLVLFLVLEIDSPSYIIGLAYYELGGKTAIIFIPSTIPSNTALVITLYNAYNPSYIQEDPIINIVGSGSENVKTVIWATYRNALQFSSNLVNKWVSYSGYNKVAVNRVAQYEFGKDADVICSSHRSPIIINTLSCGKY